tara:strand:+ start:14178 stop:15005 length:828 start_codon:yes stop_codon:yes gene_type:complete
MKTALCLYGYFNNGVNPNSGNLGFDYINRTIISKGDVDVYIHSWDVENENKMRQLYKPVKCSFEKQKNFKDVIDQNGINEQWIDEGFDRQRTIFSQCSIQSTLSFLYSRGQAIKLLKEEYECVVATRFDLGNRSGCNKDYWVSNIDFNPDINQDNIYSAMWMQLNAGYADQWFYSSQENMNILSDMNERTIDYLKKDSEFSKVLTTGWPDSHYMNNNNSKDPGQFTNEILKERVDRSSNLMRYPRWQMINNHILHKWFFIESGLYEKSKFIVGVS